MIYRQQEIQQVLADHPNGLKTVEIFNIASKKAGSELPDSSITSKLIHAMRNSTPKLISTHDAADGNRHTITVHGKHALLQALGEQGEKMPTLTPTVSDQQMQEATAIVETETKRGDDDYEKGRGIYTRGYNHDNPFKQIGFDTSDELDHALYAIVTIIKEHAEKTSVAIDQKAEKLALLESYESDNRISGPTRALFAAIRADVNELEEAE